MGHNVKLALQHSDYKKPYPIRYNEMLTTVKEATVDFEAGEWDLIHINGVWNWPYHKIAQRAYKYGVPVVWSPHGSLSRWALRYKWWKKLPAWWLYQKNDMMRATLIHVTAESEMNDIRRLGLGNRVVVAPLGVHIPICSGIETILKVPERVREKKRLLFIGRIAPIKGLDNLCRAYCAAKMYEKWRLMIVGPDSEDHISELKKLVGALHIADYVDFPGPKFGDELVRAYCESDLFVLPSYSENFGSVVIEALVHGKPVISTKGTPWKKLVEYKCGWWVDIGVEPLKNVLIEAMSFSDEELREMGERGRKMVEVEYSWPAIANKMEEAYCGILDHKMFSLD